MRINTARITWRGQIIVLHIRLRSLIMRRRFRTVSAAADFCSRHGLTMKW